MKPVARRILIAIGVAVGMLLLILGIGLGLLMGEPSYYHAAAMTREQIESAAKRVEDKLVEIRNLAVERRLDQTAGPAAGTDTVYVVTFTQDELNGFLAKWSELSAVRNAWGNRISRPAVALRKGEIILAAKTDLGRFTAVLGVHLRPTVSGEGLRLSLARLSAGRLPLPRATIEGELSRITAPLARRLPEWRRNARLDRTGAANEDALKALYAHLLIESLTDQPVDPVVLVPLDGGRGIPVRLTDIELTDGAITVQATPLDPAARSAFLRRLATPD